ncbi:MAG TPA: putative quinol monooxygenase [Xanthobacteraceae bacterium]|nr:putative quinol monooxygenase [Xanthobacteraceae bacterium]
MAEPVTRVVLRVVARESTVDQLKPVLLELAKQSRAEEGCNGYKVFQSKSEPLEFVLYESWATQEALDRHLTRPHVQTALAQGVPLLAEPPDRRVYTTID